MENNNDKLKYIAGAFTEEEMNIIINNKDYDEIYSLRMYSESNMFHIEKIYVDGLFYGYGVLFLGYDIENKIASLEAAEYFDKSPQNEQTAIYHMGFLFNHLKFQAKGCVYNPNKISTEYHELLNEMGYKSQKRSR